MIREVQKSLNARKEFGSWGLTFMWEIPDQDTDSPRIRFTGFFHNRIQ